MRVVCVTYKLVVPQGVRFASHIQFICKTGCLVYITCTLNLHDRTCGLHYAYNLFVCTRERVVCITRTHYLHDRASDLHHTYTLFARQGVWFAWYLHFICTTGRDSCGRYGRCVADQRWLGQDQVLRVSFTYYSMLRPFTSCLEFFMSIEEALDVTERR